MCYAERPLKIYLFGICTYDNSTRYANNFIRQFLLHHSVRLFRHLKISQKSVSNKYVLITTCVNYIDYSSFYLFIIKH